MSGSILWYVHDHGTGHLQRARAVVPKISAPVIVAAGPGVFAAAATAFGEGVIGLPSDIPERATTTLGPFHHAPSDRCIRARSAAIAETVAAHGCTTAVVDVSVETAVLARLLGLRVVSVRQSGVRNDDPHHLGFATADAVWIPQHRSLEPIDADDEHCDARWRFTGAFSRFDQRSPEARHETEPRQHTLVLLLGGGGNSLDVERWKAARPPAGWRVLIVGAAHRWTRWKVASVGRIDDVFAVLSSADVVVSSAGWGAVADAAAARARLVVVAEPRPFDEQLVRAQALAAHGLAVSIGCWPDPCELGDIIDMAAQLDPRRWAEFYDGRGADRAAQLIEEVHNR